MRATKVIAKDDYTLDGGDMGVAVAERKFCAVANAPRRRGVIDLGNGVMFPVKDGEEAEFLEWMVEESKAGRVSLPKRVPEPMERPAWLDSEPQMSSEDFWAFYENERADRF